MNRTAFFIDGFNLYHSVKTASYDLGLNGLGTRWLDVRALCGSYLSAVGNNAQIVDVYYFSALARHIEAFSPDVVTRHQILIECLKSTGVIVELARFKKKIISCTSCGQNIKRYEEKETDVAIAAKLMEVLILDQCDTAILVTGDTDLGPAVRTAQRLFPHKTIGFLFPYKRHNREMEKLSPLQIDIKKETYVRYQFRDPHITPKGKVLRKPPTW